MKAVLKNYQVSLVVWAPITCMQIFIEQVALDFKWQLNVNNNSESSQKKSIAAMYLSDNAEAHLVIFANNFLSINQNYIFTNIAEIISSHQATFKDQNRR